MHQLWCAVLIILVYCLIFNQAQNVGFQLNVDGINSITWNGFTYWSGANHDFPNAINWKCSDGTESNWQTKSRALDADSLGLTLGYLYGTTKFRYTPSGNKLKIDITVTNTQNCDLTFMDIVPFKINLPGSAENWVSQWSFVLCDNMMGPAACTLNGWWGTVVLANEDPVYPLGTAFPTTDNYPTNSSFQGHVYTSYTNSFPPNLEKINRIVPAKSSVTFSISLYFGAPYTNPYTLAWDSVSKWVAYRPPIINWSDRRAILKDVLAVSESDHHGPNNPRGWFGDKDFNAFDPVAFRNALIGRANTIITNCQFVNCQGVIIWDIEGQEFPHATSYIGDGSLMPKFAPEMDPVANDYVGKFKQAGMKVGFTIRPQNVWYSPSTPPILQADQLMAANNAEALQILKTKAQYAITRWGADMFYVDTNINTGGGTLDPQVFRDLQNAFPKILFLPEWESDGYYGVGAPYGTLQRGDTGSPPIVRTLYPNGFMMVDIDMAGADSKKAALQQSVLAGDVLLVSGWIPNWPDTITAKEIYAVISPTPTSLPLTSQSPSPAAASKSPSPSAAAASQSPTSSPAAASKSPSPSAVAASQSPTSSPAAASKSPSPSAVAASQSPTSSPVAASKSPTPSPAAASQSPTSSPAAASKSPSPSAVAASQSPSPSAVAASPSASASASQSPSRNRRKVTYTLTSQGVSSLLFDDKNFVNPNVPSMPSAPTVHYTDGTSDYFANPTSTSFDSTGQSITLTYPYGKTKVKFSASSNKFSMDVTVTNTGTKTIKFLEIVPLKFTFPSISTTWNGNYIMGSNMEGPTMSSLEGSWGIVTATNEDVNKPLLIGFPSCDNTPSNTLFGLRIFTEVPSNMTKTFDKLLRTIAPGASVTFKISVRFGLSGEIASDLVSDLFTKWRRQYPFDNYWGDRRPIAMEVLSSSEASAHSASNPRGWFGDSSVDVVSTQGKINFKNSLMGRAQTVIDNCAIMECQGILIWDIEGQQFPHPTSYIGDPRALPDVAPEMNEIVDEYIAKFKAAGMAVGFTVRPQRLSYNQGPTQASQTYLSNSEALTEIQAKIGYAVTRWNGSLFFVSSNINQDGAVLNPDFIRDLHHAYPNVLLVPDGRMDSYHMSSAPLGQFSATTQGTPASAEILYPESFSVTYISDQVNDNTKDEIQDMVNRGEILLVRSWYYTSEMDVIGDMISKSVFVSPQNPSLALNSGDVMKPELCMFFVIIAVLYEIIL